VIPIKKLKKQIVAEFKESAVPMEIAIQRKRIDGELIGHYLNIPWGLERGGLITVRWNIKRDRFDKILFAAFGKNHTIKL